MTNGQSVLERIQSIHDQKQTGVLSLGHGEHVISVFFDGGLISAVSTDLPQFRLGWYLVKAGLVEEPRLDQLRAEARRRRMLLGHVAVSRMLVTRRELLDLIQEQAVQILTHALKNGYGIESFDNTESSFFLPARLHLNHLMLHMARQNLMPFDPGPERLIVMRNGRKISALPWYPEELAVLMKLKSPRTLDELSTATGLDDNRLRKILSVFDTLKLVALVEKSSAESTAIARRDGFPYESLVPEISPNGLSDKLEALREDPTFAGEQFKTLKIRISEKAAARPVKVITISSSAPADGKSLISLNLAASFSKDLGRKTILIDCDLRNPSIHRLLGTSIEPGLSGYLQGEHLQPVCYMRRLGSLFLMGAGRIPPNPVELLSMERMQQLIDLLRTEFQTIILDSPPLVPITDAQILSGLSDGLILVVRSGQTSYGSLERGLKGVNRGKLLGVVLNDVKPRMFNTQHDYRYYNYRYRNRYPYGGRSPRPDFYLKSYLEQ